MGEDLLKHLRQFQTGGTDAALQLKIPLPRTDSGLVERICPSDSCVPRIFRMGNGPGAQHLEPVGTARMRRAPGGNETVCPYCGIMSDDADFLSPRDRKAALEQVQWAAIQGVGDALGGALTQIARRFNGGISNGGGLISMSMRVARGSPTPAPRPYREDLLRTLTCDVCSRRYGVYAVGLFCPDCGATNVGVHFARELELVRDQAALARITANDDQAELAFRLLGNAHEDVLTAFETYLKTLYCFLIIKRMPNEAPSLTSKKAIGNSFQNIKRAQNLYANIGIDPFGGRSSDDMELLDRNIQMRHVIGHNLGVADEDYVKKSDEVREGTTVEVTPAAITRFAEVCATVVRRIVDVSPELTLTTGLSDG